MQKYYKVSFIIVIMFLFLYAPNAEANQNEQLDIHFIDVGQGDSMLVQTPDDHNILIDGGHPEAGEKVNRFLKNAGVEKLDKVIATHPDIDHIGGLTDVMQSFYVDKLIDTGKIHSTRTYAKYLGQIFQSNIPVKIVGQDELIQFDSDIKARVLNAHQGSQTSNASSIVLKVTYDNIDFLLMSDVGREQEKRMMKSYDLDSDVLKVAHHGSKTSTSLAFLKEVNPDVSILTYGRGNDYGHPVDRVMDNLKEVNTNIYPTSMFGDITIKTDGKAMQMRQTKSPMDYLKSG